MVQTIKVIIQQQSQKCKVCVCRKTQKTNFLKICACVFKGFFINELCKNFYFYYKKHNGSIQLVEIYKLKVIKTAAFCHNRALQDLYPDSYRLLFTTGSFTLTASPLSKMNLTSSAFNVRTCWKDRNLLVLVEYEAVLVCRGALELYYSRIAYYSCD